MKQFAGEVEVRGLWGDLELTVAGRLVDLMTRAQAENGLYIVRCRYHLFRLVPEYETIVGAVALAVPVGLDGSAV